MILEAVLNLPGTLWTVLSESGLKPPHPLWFTFAPPPTAQRLSVTIRELALFQLQPCVPRRCSAQAISVTVLHECSPTCSTKMASLQSGATQPASAHSVALQGSEAPNRWSGGRAPAPSDNLRHAEMTAGAWPGLLQFRLGQTHGSEAHSGADPSDSSLLH